MRTRITKSNGYKKNDRYGNACLLAAFATPAGFMYQNPNKVQRIVKSFWLW